ncbi:40S ribosomal protein SA [Frankliniella fusca]|uniref:40S ribosomal protein SA n=1 Tax=Frankliniella fusca TaxID=407009 RepID=A0AAE1L9K8_9NEOP|nr:40S ribosomal protein SA [Frankliniella fusca]
MDVDEMHGSDDERNESSDEEEEDADLSSLELLPNGRRDMQHAAVNMVVEMRSYPGMTREDVSEYLNMTGRLNDPRAQRLLSKFSGVNPFKGLKSDNGQRSGIKKYYHFIEPETIFINERMDQRLVGEGAYGLVPVPNTYQYASVIEFLKMLARKNNVMD